MNNFDLKTKTLVLTVLLSILIAGYLSYQRTFVERDFEIFDSEAGTEEDSLTEETPIIQEVDMQPVITEEFSSTEASSTVNN